LTVSAKAPREAESTQMRGRNDGGFMACHGRKVGCVTASREAHKWCNQLNRSAEKPMPISNPRKSDGEAPYVRRVSVGILPETSNGRLNSAKCAPIPSPCL